MEDDVNIKYFANKLHSTMENMIRRIALNDVDNTVFESDEVGDIYDVLQDYKNYIIITTRIEVAKLNKNS